LLPFILAACGDASQSPMAQARPPTPVSVVALTTEPVALSRELPGRTRAFVIAEVRPLVTGIVKERLFVEGAEVQAGDPLYQLAWRKLPPVLVNMFTQPDHQGVCLPLF
jgi:membrane fusion protein (multidrug efflux system)